MKRTSSIVLSLFAFGSSLFAAPTSFDFKDPKGVNNIVFLLDAPLESINGTATGISGAVSFDPLDPGATRGKIVVEVESLQVANPKMLEHLRGETWMAAATYPQISFELSSIKQPQSKGNKTDGLAVGVLTLRGVSKEVELPVSLTFLEGALAQRQKVEGDILVVRSSFTVKRSDYGINAGSSEDKVSDEIELRLSLAGSAPR